MKYQYHKPVHLNYLMTVTSLKEKIDVIRYFELALWGFNKVKCPKCNCKEFIEIKKRRYRKQCSDCSYQYSITTGHPIFHNTKTPLVTWLQALLLLKVYEPTITISKLGYHLQLNYHTAKLIWNQIKESGDTLDSLLILPGLPNVIPNTKTKFWELMADFKVNAKQPLYFDQLFLIASLTQKEITGEEKVYYKKLSKVVEGYKRKMDLKDAGLADKLPISLRQLMKYKSGRDRWQSQIIYPLTKLFKVPLNQLLVKDTGIEINVDD